MRKETGLAFGQVLEALKDGATIARAGWNGKGMFLYLATGSLPSGTEDTPYYEGVRRDLFEDGDKDTRPRLPNINMRSATGSIVTGWLASQTDMLAEDWKIVEPFGSAG